MPPKWFNADFRIAVSASSSDCYILAELEDFLLCLFAWCLFCFASVTKLQILTSLYCHCSRSVN